jgi:hypothetical protein
MGSALRCSSEPGAGEARSLRHFGFQVQGDATLATVRRFRIDIGLT